MNSDQKKYILDNIKTRSVKEIARHLGLKEKNVHRFLEEEKARGPVVKAEEKTRKKKNMIPVVLSCVLLVAVCAFVYAGALSGKMVLDDDLLITDNTYVKSFIHLKKLFTEDMGSGIGLASSYYRPLQAFSYLVNYHFWKLDTFPYHMTNLVFHVLFVLAIYWMVIVVFRRRTLALFTALLFSIHPIQPESVSYISGLGDCMVGFFTVLVFVLYVKQLEKGSFFIYAALFLAYFVGLFTKENILVLPAIFVAYHIAFRKKIKIYPFIGMVIMTMTYLMFRVTLLKATSQNMSLNAIFDRMPGVFAAIAGYAKILAWPFDLYMGHETKQFFMSDPSVIFGIIIVLASAVIAIVSLRKNNLVFFAIAWFFITLLPVSNLYPLTFYMADHYLYLPAVGIFLVLAQGLEALYRNKNTVVKIIAVCIVAGITAGFSYLTIEQNKYWSTPKAFYERTLKYNPRSPMMWCNLAKEYIKLKDHEKAIEYYKKAIEIDPYFVNAHYNLGATYSQLGRGDEALASCMKAIEIDPAYTHSYNIVGAVYWAKGENEKAIEYFNKAVMVSPSNIIALCNLAAAYVKVGKRDEAIEMLNRAIQANPDYPLSYANLAAIYGEGDQKDKEKAVEISYKAISLNPNDSNVWNNLGKIYYDLGKRSEALDAFKKASILDPNNVSAKNNLSIVSGQMGGIDSAAK